MSDVEATQLLRKTVEELTLKLQKLELELQGRNFNVVVKVEGMKELINVLRKK